jgi:1,4-dihydroxy-6-naphthoate synthase
MEKTLSLGYSPCPNDTFIFHALVHGKVDTTGLAFRETLLDVEALNQMALKGKLDVSKVSYHALGFLREEYCLLRSGGALGKGCGPMIVAKNPITTEDLRGKKIAIPGRLTTAYLLMQLYDAALKDVEVMTFDSIMEAVASGSVDAGLIIHEGRFTYPRYGLNEVIDLGQWWEELTGNPIPLGCIVAKRSLGSELINKVDALIKESILYAQGRPKDPVQYIKEHAQELEDSVIREHINLYVNDYSVDIGAEGAGAVEELFSKAEALGIIKGSSRPLFAD